MMRKIGLKRPNKLNLGAKKVSPPIVPGDGGSAANTVNRISGVYSEHGDYRDTHGVEFNVSYDSIQSDVYCEQTRELVSDNCSDSSYGQTSGSSSGYGSNIQYDTEYRLGTSRQSLSTFHQPLRQSEFKEPLHPGTILRHTQAPYQASTPGSSIGSPGDPRDTSRMSMTSLDSGWSSNNVQMTSFCSQTSSSSVHSERTSMSHDDCDLKNKPNTSFQHKRLSTMSTGYPPVIAPQRTSSIRSSLRGSQESVSSSRTSQSDIYRSGSSQRRYSSSSSISSSRNGDDSICSMDVRNMIAQGLPDLEIVNCWLTDLRFQEYFSLFASAGYDLPTISRMTPEDLTAIGIKKPHHRKKIKSEIDKLHLQDWLPQHVPHSVEEMMHLLNLSQYCPTLAAQGYNNVKDVLSISIEDLEDIGFFMLGHQKRLLLGIKRLKELRSGKKLSLPEYHPEEVTMSSLPPTLNSKQSFSSFHALPDKSSTSSSLMFPPHPDQPPNYSSNQFPNIIQSEMPAPMQPLNHNFYHNLTRNSPQEQNVHTAPNPNSTIGVGSIWQKFPSYQEQMINEHPSSTSTHVQIHDYSKMSGHTAEPSGTLTRQNDLQQFNCEFFNSGTLPRPTATVKPLTPTGDSCNTDVPVVCDDLCNDNNMPFANERLGTIRLKTNPQEAFAEYEKQNEDEMSAKDDLKEVPKNLLRTPTRAANRSATDVMDDISSMLADLTTELDSMLCSDSVNQ